MCESILQYVLDRSREGGKLCMNMYDFRLRDLNEGEGCGMSWPFALRNTTEYLGVMFEGI
jgi:hypothetical protein